MSEAVLQDHPPEAPPDDPHQDQDVRVSAVSQVLQRQGERQTTLYKITRCVTMYLKDKVRGLIYRQTTLYKITH